VLAEQAWRVLRDRGLETPRDVSLVAFDDVPWMEMVQPPITAVRQPAFEMGRRAALLLLRRLDDPTCGRTVEVLQPELVVRGSTAPKS
jgi:LacI family transcriptional regulator